MNILCLQNINHISVVWGKGGQTPNLIYFFFLSLGSTHTFLERMNSVCYKSNPDDVQHRHLRTNLATGHGKGVCQGMNSPSTSLAFHILLALTNARIWVASWLVSPTARRITTARLAPLAAEVVVVLFTPVTLLPSHSRFTLTLAFAVTLQTPRS